MSKKQGNVFTRAKSIRKKHPRKFKTWAEYVSYAGKHHKAGTKKRKVSGVGATRKKVTRKKGKARKRTPRKKVTTVKVSSVQKTISGKKRQIRKRSAPKQKHRRRSVSGKGTSNLLVLGALGVGAYLLISSMNKPAAPTTPYYGQYGQLQPTSNVVRNTQSQDMINYAIAAGLTADAISKLVTMFNNSSDDQIKQTYDYVNTTGDINAYV